MARNIAFIIAAVVIIGTGVLHGHRMNRWGEDGALTEAAARLDRIPMTIGDWKGVDREIDDREVMRAEASRIFARDYVNEKEGGAISVLVVCGRPGPVAVHTPEVCFQGAGRVQRDAKVKVVPTLNEESETPQEVEFWTADFFRPADIIPTFQRVFWTWSHDGQWQAPDNPRATFMWNNKLYKVYLVRSVSSMEESEEESRDLAIEFAEQLFPALDKALFSDTPAQPSK